MEFDLFALTLQIKETCGKNHLFFSLYSNIRLMKDRIKMIMDHRNMTQKMFANAIGISEGSLSGVLNGRTRPTLQIVDAIHTSFPNISLEWLLYGRDPMTVDDTSADTENLKQSPAPDSGTNIQAKDLFSSVLDQPSTVTDNKSIHSVQNDALGSPQTIVKYIDKPERQIVEVRIFYDDQTWESFVPK